WRACWFRRWCSSPSSSGACGPMRPSEGPGSRPAPPAGKRTRRRRATPIPRPDPDIRTRAERRAKERHPSMAKEQTLVLVKPDGVARGLTGEILARIEAKGYSLVDIKMITPERELLARHYAE